MRQYTWDEYYEKFYDWGESTRVCNLSALTSLGTADEVAVMIKEFIPVASEIIIELQVDIPAANCLLQKAVEAKLAFSGSDLVEFVCINDKELATAAVRNSAERLTADDMEYLYGEIDDEVIVEICKQRNILLPEYLREEYEEANIYIDDCVPESPAPKLGFFCTLAAVFAGAGVGASSDQGGEHNGRCNGDFCTLPHICRHGAI